MVAGHFGFAAMVKARERQVPLWTLMLAAAWLDVLFLPLYAVGIERTGAAPGTSGTVYGETVIHADYTHSLLGAAILSAAFGIACAIWWNKRTGTVLGLVAFSSWLLDLVVRRADLAILPGNIGDLPRLGLGLWRLPAWSAGLELALVLIGGLLYWRAAVRAANESRRGVAHFNGALMLVSGVAILALSLFGL